MAEKYAVLSLSLAGRVLRRPKPRVGFEPTVRSKANSRISNVNVCSVPKTDMHGGRHRSWGKAPVMGEGTGHVGRHRWQGVQPLRTAMRPCYPRFDPYVLVDKPVANKTPLNTLRLKKPPRHLV